MSEMGQASPENDHRPGAIFALIIGIDEVSAFFLHHTNGARDPRRNRTTPYTVTAVGHG
jgi:hypothetical protein